MPEHSTDFTLAEFSAMQRALRKRFDVARDPNLVDVGFGIALKDNRIDRKRGLVATFFVSTKRKRRRCRHPIPTQVTLRVRTIPVFQKSAASRQPRVQHGRSYWQRAVLATDVVELPGLVPTGCRYSARHVGPATAGAVVIWQEQSNRGKQHFCGILTVGHAFTREQRPLVLFRGSSNGRDFNGRLYRKSRRASSVDAAIIQVHPDDLVDCGIIDADLVVHGIIDPEMVFGPPIASLGELTRLQGSPGLLLRDQSPVRLSVHSLLPSMTIPTLGTLHNVVSAWSRGYRPFRPGTSGAVWEIEHEPAAMQVAGTPDGFQLGFGQALDSSLAWAEAKLNESVAFVAGSFRLVTAF
jgi:hypothetical protein